MAVRIAPERSGRLAPESHQLAALEVRRILAGILDSAEDAMAALDRDDVDAFAEALAAREPLQAQMAPHVRALAEARAAYAAHPPEHPDRAAVEALIDPIDDLASRALAADARLAEIAQARRQEIAGELDALAQNAATLAAYRAGERDQHRLDVVR